MVLVSPEQLLGPIGLLIIFSYQRNTENINLNAIKYHTQVHLVSSVILQNVGLILAITKTSNLTKNSFKEKNKKIDI